MGNDENLVHEPNNDNGQAEKHAHEPLPDPVHGCMIPSPSHVARHDHPGNPRNRLKSYTAQMQTYAQVRHIFFFTDSRMKRLIRILLLPLALAAGLLACTQRAAPASRFVLLDGSVQTEQILQGKVTLVTFWATSCAACVEEMPLLVQTWQQYQARGYQTLAVAMQQDPVSYVVNFARSRQLPFTVAIDHDGRLAQNWGPVRATPMAFLVNRQGQIVQRYVGPIAAPELRAAIDKHLAAP